MIEPRRYETQQLRRRVTRPLQSKRAAILANAEAAFKGKMHDEKKLDQQRQDDTRSSTDTHDESKVGRK